MRTCAAYDSTIKSLGFDEIRIRYRQQRRSIIREIISRCIIGEPLQVYIQTEANKLIPLNDRKAFIEDLKEDLQQLDQSRIAGIGITLEQLNEWIKKS